MGNLTYGIGLGVRYNGGMAKRRKTTTTDTGRMEPRMWRVNQRAVKFSDRKKAASRKACRGKVYA